MMFFFFLSKDFHFKPLVLALNANGWLSPGITDLKPSSSLQLSYIYIYIYIYYKNKQVNDYVLLGALERT